MPIARANGVALYPEGSGTRAPLVLVHGFACRIQSSDPQARIFSRSRRVIALDVRGRDAPAPRRRSP